MLHGKVIGRFHFKTLKIAFQYEILPLTAPPQLPTWWLRAFEEPLSILVSRLFLKSFIFVRSYDQLINVSLQEIVGEGEDSGGQKNKKHSGPGFLRSVRDKFNKGRLSLFFVILSLLLCLSPFFSSLFLFTYYLLFSITWLSLYIFLFLWRSVFLSLCLSPSPPTSQISIFFFI